MNIVNWITRKLGFMKVTDICNSFSNMEANGNLLIGVREGVNPELRMRTYPRDEDWRDHSEGFRPIAVVFPATRDEGKLAP